MNFSPLYRGAAAAGTTATVATLALVVVVFIASQRRKEAAEEKKTLEELSSGESLQKVLKWDRSQFMKHQDVVLPAVRTALQGGDSAQSLEVPSAAQKRLSSVGFAGSSVAVALKVLSHENCPRSWLEESSDQVLPLLKDRDESVKYLAVYALYSNLRLASEHLQAIKDVRSTRKKDSGWSGDAFTRIVNRVEKYVRRYIAVKQELSENFDDYLTSAKPSRVDDESYAWVQWAMEWVWDRFDSDELDYRVHLCSRLLDDEYVGKCWLELTQTLNYHRKAPWLQNRSEALAEHMTIVEMCANQPAKRLLAGDVLIYLKDTPSLRKFKIDVSKAMNYPQITDVLPSSPTALTTNKN